MAHLALKEADANGIGVEWQHGTDEEYSPQEAEGDGA
jgi:hypothetical protein